MANRQSAPGSRPGGRGNTARVVLHKNALPGWFWGMLGCLSVLGIGFGVLIFVAKSGFLAGGAVGPGTASPAAAPAADPAAAPAAPPAPPAPHAGPQIEPLAPAPVPAAVPAAAADSKPRALSHPGKSAHSPSGGHATATASAARDKSADKAAGDKPSADKGDDSSAAKKPADKAATDDDQVVRHHKTAASDEDDDSDSDN